MICIWCPVQRLVHHELRRAYGQGAAAQPRDRQGPDDQANSNAAWICCRESNDLWHDHRRTPGPGGWRPAAVV